MAKAFLNSNGEVAVGKNSSFQKRDGLMDKKHRTFSRSRPQLRGVGSPSRRASPHTSRRVLRYFCTLRLHFLLFRRQQFCQFNNCSRATIGLQLYRRTTPCWHLVNWSTPIVIYQRLTVSPTTSRRWITSISQIDPRDAPCQLLSCQVLQNFASRIRRL